MQTIQPNNKPQAILFDLDGTLLDNSEIVVDAYYTGMQELGYQPQTREYISTLAGKSTIETAKSLKLKEEDYHKLDAWFWQYFNSYCKNTEEPIKLLDGVRKVLKLIESHTIKMAIVTSNSSENAKILLEKAGILQSFETIIGRDNVKHAKPAAEPVLTALEKMKLSPTAQIWMVGDSASDIGAARNAKVTSIGIPQPHTIDEVISEEPEVLVNSMQDLYLMLRSIFE